MHERFHGGGPVSSCTSCLPAIREAARLSGIDDERREHAAEHDEPVKGCPFCANMNPRRLTPGIGKEDVLKGLPPYNGNNSNRGAMGDILGEDERAQRRMRMKEEARIALRSPKAGPRRGASAV